VAVGVDPFRTVRWWRGQGQVEDRDELLMGTAAAHGHDLVINGLVESSTMTLTPRMCVSNGTARFSWIMVKKSVICSDSL
jgi:hypothetical protein